MSGGVVVEAARYLAARGHRYCGSGHLMGRRATTFARSGRRVHCAVSRRLREGVAWLRPQDVRAGVRCRSRRTILSAVASAPSRVGIEALEATLGNDQNLRVGLDEIRLPIALINSPHWQVTNVEAAHRRDIEVTLVPGVGHSHAGRPADCQWTYRRRGAAISPPDPTTFVTRPSCPPCRLTVRCCGCLRAEKPNL